jgi:hypothetical protein
MAPGLRPRSPSGSGPRSFAPVRPGRLPRAAGLRRALTVAGVALVPLTTAQRFFLAHNHSATAVAYLAVAGTLATTVQILPEQLTAPFPPGLAALEAAGRLRDLRALCRKGLAELLPYLGAASILTERLARRRQPPAGAAGPARSPRVHPSPARPDTTRRPGPATRTGVSVIRQQM